MWVKTIYNAMWAKRVHEVCAKYPDVSGDSVIEGNLTKENYLMKIIPANKEKELAEYMIDAASRANDQVFGFNIWYDIKAIQYTTYKSEQKMEYDWHADSVWYGKPVVQKLTAIICLTDEKDYEGGDFVIAGRKETRIKLTVGQAIVFPSPLQHKVTPVTKGTRNTLVAWFKGPRWM